MKIALPVVKEVKEFKQNHARALEELCVAPDLDERMRQEHQQAFTEIDCMKCAHCCKTTGPLFVQEDMDRLAALLDITTGDFIQRYLEMDEDGDFVLKVLPCPFLRADNQCSVYAHRPKACREYPHTDRGRQSDIFELTLKNMEICPGVWRIVRALI